MIELNSAHIVGLGGAIGAMLRYYITKKIKIDRYPAGTFTVNTVGSFGLGLITFLGLDTTFILLLGTGVCGSFTTFSTFSFDTVRLWRTGYPYRAAFNAVLNFIASITSIGLAWILVYLFT